MTEVHEIDVASWPTAARCTPTTPVPTDGAACRLAPRHAQHRLAPAPLFAEAERLGLRWVGYDRPGYGGSTPRPDRTVGSAAADAAAVVDALGIERFAVMGHSGGGPHALACAALLPDRVLAAVSAAGPAPYGATGLDWFAGMADPAALQAAVARSRGQGGVRGVAEHEGEPGFTAADEAALEGEWSWFIEVVAPGGGRRSRADGRRRPGPGRGPGAATLPRSRAPDPVPARRRRPHRSPRRTGSGSRRRSRAPR